MNFFEWVGGALGGRQAAQQQAEEAGLPPLTFEDYVRRRDAQGILGTAAEQGIYPQMGMEAFPFGPRGPGPLGGPSANYPVPYKAPGLPAVPGQLAPYRGPLQGQVQGGEIVGPLRAAPGVGRGNVYDGTVVPPGSGGAGPGQNVINTLQRVFGGNPSQAAGGGAGRARPTNTRTPSPDSGPIPMGGPTKPTGTGRGVSPYPDTRLGRIQENFANLTGLQKAGLAGLGAGSAWSLPDIVGRIFGGEETEAGTAFPGIPLPGGTGQGATAGLPRVNELPSAWRSEMQEMVPSVDYDSLPRPDFDRARQMLLDLAPEAPEERNWLDKLPSQMKSMLGFGILLGPIGLLLGAGLGMAENRAIDKARQERFKQESREHLEQLIENDLNWSLMERQMELGDRQGRREEAREDITLERMFQQWGMDDASWMQDMNLKRAQEAALHAGLQGGQGSLTLDQLWENALMVAPDMAMQGYLQQMEQVSPAAWAQMTNDQKNEMQRMFQANVMRGLYR